MAKNTGKAHLLKHTLIYLDDIRSQIAPDDLSLKEAADRRDTVRMAAERFPGSLRSFNSGSLAHRTANCPIHQRDAGLDADCGLVLDRRAWTRLGPDSSFSAGPTETVRELISHLKGELAGTYPNATYEMTKRAILIRVNEPLPNGQDPTIDLVLALDRRGKPGLWIPNTHNDTWDASHPEEHTGLLTADPCDLRLVRQHAIRLGKAENKREEDVPLCSFNLEAFGLMFVTRHRNDAEALLVLWTDGAADLRRRLTPDPAGVSKPINVEDVAYAVMRLEFAAGHLQAALDRDWDEEHVRSHLYELWPEFVSSYPGAETKARLVAASRNPASSVYYSGAGLSTATVAGAATVATSVRSYGEPH